MKAEKATNIALEYDELTDTLETNRYECSHMCADRVGEIPKTISKNNNFIITVVSNKKTGQPQRGRPVCI